MDKRSVGLLRIKVQRGIDLAIRDICSSDPYVVVTMGTEQRLKTRVINRNCNPEWNEEVTLSVTNPHLPIKLTVFDSDTFSGDDEMGDADIDIKLYLECLAMMDGVNKQGEDGGPPPGTVVRRVRPGVGNCLAEESKVVWLGKGKMVQDMVLRLRNVEKGLVQIQIEWIDILPCSSAGNGIGVSPFSPWE